MLNKYYEEKDITIYHGNVLNILRELSNNSIDCVITSPPYWSLRDYETPLQIWDGVNNCEHDFSLKEIQTDQTHWNTGGKVVPYKERTIRNGLKQKMGFCVKCNAWLGSLGLEPTFNLYIKHLCDIFDEVKRVLKNGGTCWVNLGDTYYSVSGGKFLNDNLVSKERNIKNGNELRPKNLCNIPARFSIEMQNRGWILRNEIVWFKRSCMPSSVQDRFNVDFEKIFFFTKNEDYYFEMQYEPLSKATVNDISKRKNLSKGDGSRGSKHFGEDTPYSNVVTNRNRLEFCDLEKGRHKRCVWDIPTKPFKDAHFATFPEALVEPMIKAGCPEEICIKCKTSRKKIYKNLANNDDIRFGKYGDGYNGLAEGTKRKCPNDYQIKQTFIGYKECNCKSEFEGGIVLDPFSGAFTTGIVAKKLKRKFIGIELNEKYIKEIGIPRLQNTQRGLF